MFNRDERYTLHVEIDQRQIERGLVHCTIEKALRGIGDRTCKEVGNSLFKKYECYFADCLEHPEYLKNVLGEIYGKASMAIIDSIQDDLKEFTEQKPISTFLVQLSR